VLPLPQSSRADSAYHERSIPFPTEGGAPVTRSFIVTAPVEIASAPRADASIPLVLLDNRDPALFEELMAAVERVAAQAAFTLGDEVSAFEQEFAAYCGAQEAVGVSSGTDALALALQANGIGPGDEVIVPANSFIATAEAVTLVGATPVFADVEERTQLVTAETLEPHVGARTRAVVPVHLYGRTVHLDPVLEFARDHRLVVIEDACQGHGARYRGRRVGTFGRCGCFSFYPAKNLGAWGDAGAVVTDDREIAERLRLLRSHGESSRYQHHVTGTTARLHAIQAAVLRVKLRRLDSWNTARRRFAAELTQALSETSLELPPPADPGHDHVFHQYVVRTIRRDALRRQLEKRGIATGLHYPVPIHRSPAYQSAQGSPPSLPVVDRLAGSILSLPVLPVMVGRDRSELATRIGEAVRDGLLEEQELL
jgi:dTDP-4-amino-4,6-dideoxygalactose transaminase